MMPLVDTYCLYRNDGDHLEGIERVDQGQLRFLLRGSGEMTYPDGRVEAMRPVMINGPGTAAATYRATGPLACFSVSLRAIGWKTLIGIPAHKVTDHIIDGEKLFCEEATLLLARLRQMDTLAEMVAALEPLLKMRRHEVKPVPQAHLPFLRAMRDWTVIEDATLDQLYAMVRTSSGLGERQVQRLCRDYFGSAPMLLKRKFRAIRAAIRLYQGAPLSDVLGPFADQSHMINEMKHFTGHTPRSLRERVDPRLAATLDRESPHFLPDVIPEELVDPRRK